MTRRQIAAEVAQIARDWMLEPCDPKDFEIQAVESEAKGGDLAKLLASLDSYLVGIREISHE